MKNNKMNIVVVSISIVILIGFILVGDFNSVIQTLKNSQPVWILVSFLCILFYWLLEGIVLFIMIKKLNGSVKFKDIFKTTMLGQFFNCTTPFASGGQPMQAYHMSTYGVSVGTATSALIAKFIVYQSVLTVYSLALIFFNIGFFNEGIPGFKILVIIGFIVNLIVVAFLFSVSLFKNPTKKLFYGIIKFLHKIHIIKNLDFKLKQVDDEVDKFYENFKIIKKQKKELFNMAILTVIQLTAYFAIPFFIYLGFGLNTIVSDVAVVSLQGFFIMISAQGFVLMISSFFPLPGAMGASEFSFFSFFKMFFGQSVSTAMIIWRFYTFYLPIIIGAFFSVKIDKNKKVKKDKKV
ncbi:MAG: lysylphosphatidylglycerol synthase transmembrane domain-containing protein, partial [Oscillospiraceae bacterium]